jgi:hypothetical protein
MKLQMYRARHLIDLAKAGRERQHGSTLRARVALLIAALRGSTSCSMGAVTVLQRGQAPSQIADYRARVETLSRAFTKLKQMSLISTGKGELLRLAWDGL